MSQRIGLEAVFDLDQWDLAVRRYLDSVDRMERRTSNIATSIGAEYAKLGGLIAAGLAAAATAVGTGLIMAGREFVDWTTAAVEKSVDFEQSMADIASVMQVARDEAQPLAEVIDKLALDPHLKVSTDEAADAIEQLARNGISMTDVIEGAAEATVLLANASGGDFSKAADVATLAMHMFNLEADDLIKVADISQGVIHNSRIELEDWALALGNGGAAAAILGVSLEDFATVTAGTINSFHSARQAGTGFMNFLQRLVPITKPAANEMRELGLFSGLMGDEFDKLADDISKTEKQIAALDPTSKTYSKRLNELNQKLQEQRNQLNAGNNAFFDAEGNLKSMAEVTQILTEATRNLSDEERVEAFRRIFGNDALETAIRLSQMGSEAFNQLKSEIVIYGSAAEAAAIRTETLSARWENLGDVWDAIQRKSGKPMEDMLFNLVERLTELTDDVQDRVIAFFTNFAEMLDRLVERAMPWVEEMLPIFIDNLEALGYWFVNLVETGDAWNASLADMSPKFQEFVSTVIRVVEWVGALAEAVWGAIQRIREFISPITDFIAKHVELEDVILAAEGAILAFLAPIGLAATKLLAVGAAATAVIAYFRDFKSNTRSLVDEAIVLLNTSLGDLIPAFDALEGPIFDWIAENVELKDVIMGVVGALVIFNQKAIVETVASIASIILKMGSFGLAIAGIGVAVAALTIAWQNDWGNIREIVDHSMKGISHAVQTGVLVSGNILDAFMHFLHGNWALGWAELVDGVALIWQDLSNLLIQGLERVEKWLLTGGGWEIIAWFGELFPTILKGFAMIWQALVEELGLLWQDLTAEFQAAGINWINIIGAMELALGSLLIFASGLIHVVGGLLRTLINMAQGAGDIFVVLIEGWKAVFAAMRGNPIALAIAVRAQHEAMQNLIENATQTGTALEDVWEGLLESGMAIGHIMNARMNDQLTGMGFDLAASMTNAVIDTKSALQDGLDETLRETEMQTNRFADAAKNVGSAFSGEMEFSFSEAARKAIEGFSGGWSAEWPAWEEKIQGDMGAAGEQGGSAAAEGMRQGFTDSSAGVTEAVLDLRENLSYGINLDEVFRSAGVSSLQELRDGWASQEGTTVDQVVEFVNEIVLLAYGLKTGFIQAGEDSILEYAKALAQKRGIAESEAIQFVESVVGAMAGENQNFMTVGADSMKKYKWGVDEAKPEVVKSFEDVAEESKAPILSMPGILGEKGEEGMEELKAGTEKKKPETLKTFEAVRDEADTLFDELIPMMESTGASAMVAVAYGLRTRIEALTGPEGALQSAIDGTDEKMGEILLVMHDRGEGAMLELAAGMITQQPKVQRVFTDMADWIHNWTGDLLNYLRNRGEQAIVEMAAGMRSQLDTVVAVFADLRTRIVAEMDRMTQEVVAKFQGLGSQVAGSVDVNAFSSVGTNIGQAFTTGIQSQVGAAQAAAQQLVDVAAQAAAAAAQIASPSKRFMKLGADSGEGYIAGWIGKLSILEKLINRGIGNLAVNLGDFGGSDLSALGTSAAQGIQQRVTEVVQPGMAQNASYVTNSRSVQIGPVYIQNGMDQADFEFRVRQIIRDERF